MKFSNKFSFLFSHQALSSGKTCPIKDDWLCDACYMLLVCKLNVYGSLFTAVIAIITAITRTVQLYKK